MSSAYAETFPSNWVAVRRNSVTNDPGRSADPPALTSMTMPRDYRGSRSPALRCLRPVCPAVPGWGSPSEVSGEISGRDADPAVVVPCQPLTSLHGDLRTQILPLCGTPGVDSHDPGGDVR